MKYELTGTVVKFENEEICRSYYTWEFREDDPYMNLEKALRIIGEGKKVKITVEEI